MSACGSFADGSTVHRPIQREDAAASAAAASATSESGPKPVHSQVACSNCARSNANKAHRCRMHGRVARQRDSAHRRFDIGVITRPAPPNSGGHRDGHVDGNPRRPIHRLNHRWPLSRHSAPRRRLTRIEASRIWPSPARRHDLRTSQRPKLRNTRVHPQQVGQIRSIAQVVLHPLRGEALDPQRVRQVHPGTRRFMRRS
jgi:hypothetical protein